MSTTLQALRTKLAGSGQEHLLTFAGQLSARELASLASEIEALDLAEIGRLVRTYVVARPEAAIPARLEPVECYPSRAGASWNADHYRTVGWDLIRRGKVAAFTVAGGQGTRLGFDGPKGCYPAGAVTGKPLFQVFAEGILATGRRVGRAVPWYIMTSPGNHEATMGFFQKHAFFGLSPQDVMFFPQGTMPSFEMGSGRILLAQPGALAVNPDGHGGCIRALHASGAINDMHLRGVEHISYFQVDNPLVRVIDPVFLGLHAKAPDSSGEMSSKMVPKAYAGEKMGVFCLIDGRTGVIEYSDLPKDLTEAKRADGSLRFSAGSIAIHAISVEFLTRLATNPAYSLAYHRAEKPVEHVDLATGQRVKPDRANAVKLERFVFDALAMCSASIVLETDRQEEFAPIKNATGVDSVDTCRQIQTARSARWLSKAGVKVPRKADGTPDCVLEISPLTALESRDLVGRAWPGGSAPSIAAGDRVAL